MFDNFDLIHAYTRAQAIEDGNLIDVTEPAKEAGFTFPVAVTARVWHELVVPEPRARKLGQSEGGRLWDLLWVFSRVALRHGNTDVLHFNVLFVLKARQRRLIRLKAVIGPGDSGEGVITIMLPDED